MSQVGDICAGLLKPQADLGSGTRQWVTPDTRFWLTAVSRCSAETAQVIGDFLRVIYDQLEYQKVGHLLTSSRGT